MNRNEKTYITLSLIKYLINSYLKVVDYKSHVESLDGVIIHNFVARINL